LSHRAGSDREFDLLTAHHLSKVRAAFQTANVFIFTLGLTEAWTSSQDGAVFPVCPGTLAGTFNSNLHVLRNFTVAEVVDDLSTFIREYRHLNAAVRIVLTVSPVPLVATATGKHVLAATTYSKSVLRVAAEEVVRSHSDVVYFPAYEIVTGSQAQFEVFEADRRNVSLLGIEAVMSALLMHCESSVAAAPTSPGEVAGGLSQLIASMECEEEAVRG